MTIEGGQPEIQGDRRGAEPVRIKKRPFAGLMRVLNNKNLSVRDKLRVLASRAVGGDFDPEATVIEDDIVPIPTSTKPPKPQWVAPGPTTPPSDTSNFSFMEEGMEEVGEDKTMDANKLSDNPIETVDTPPVRKSGVQLIQDDD